MEDNDRPAPPPEEDDNWLPPNEIDLTKEEGDPGDRSTVRFDRKRARLYSRFNFGKRHYFEMKSDTPAGTPESLSISAAIIGITVVVAALIGATVAAAASAPWWGVLVAGAGFAVIAVGVWTWIYLLIRRNA